MERPKSIVLSAASSFWSTKRKFSGLRSRCMTPMEWHTSTTPTMTLASSAAFLSV
uniref:Cl146_1 n=1 Tax=Arundo donax TaxID=35708 RepID=A0A0A9GFN2_ARUDO